MIRVLMHTANCLDDDEVDVADDVDSDDVDNDDIYDDVDNVIVSTYSDCNAHSLNPHVFLSHRFSPF